VIGVNQNTGNNENFIKTSGESGLIWVKPVFQILFHSVNGQRQPWDKLPVVDFTINS
jgi:hypothetical protein